jgi:hypothetical protein
VDKFAIFNIIHGLATKYKINLEDRVEYCPGTLIIQFLLDWFKENDGAMGDDSLRLIVIPTPGNLEKIGYSLRRGLDIKKNVMQCYCDSDTGDVLKMRIVRCEAISSKLESLLWEQGGILKVQ